MKVWIPQTLNEPVEQRVSKMKSLPALRPFHPQVVEWISRLSQTILRDPAMKRYPEMMAMAYWFRKVNLLEMQAKFEQPLEEGIRRPRGVVLHFAPSNVDSIFVYSWMISLLCGNANLVRVSTKAGEQLNLLLAVINGVMNQPGGEEIESRTLVLTYDHDETTTGWLSSFCHTRVIWGGDETVKRIRAIPLPPLSTEIVFGDRFSSAVLAASQVADLNETGLNGLAEKFYNDAFWFDQMACSSPRLVIWSGTPEEVQIAKQKFWNAVNRFVQERYPMVPAVKMIHFAEACRLATLDYVDQVQLSGTSRVSVTNVEDSLRETGLGGGFFLETIVSHLREAALFLTEKDQTLTHYGFDRDQLSELAERLPNRSVDRIVPVGQALQFSTVWDGYDLLESFTRRVDIRTNSN